MSTASGLTAASVLELEVTIGPEADAEEFDEATTLLREELLDLDVEDVSRPAGEPPRGTRAVGAIALAGLVITASKDVLIPVLQLVAGWVNRNKGSTVKVTLGDHSIEIGSASAEEQRRLIDAFVAATASR